MSKIAIIANERSGGGTWASCAALIAGDDTYEVCALGDKAIESIVAEVWQRGCRTIVAAGGDGTVSAVASAIMVSGIDARMGVLPLGTLNHFAKDLRIPTDYSAALGVIREGHTQYIDVAAVNGRYFINNSSIGLYPYLVSIRESLQRRGWRKWTAFARAILAFAGRHVSFTVRLQAPGGYVEKKTSSVFVGNNRYVVEGLAAGGRTRLDEGTLFVALLRSMHVFGFVRLAYRALWGNLLEDRDFNVVGLRECVVESSHGRLLVACDGEIVALDTPLRYSIQHKALQVIVPNV